MASDEALTVRAGRSVGRHRALAACAGLAILGMTVVGFVRHAKLTVPYLLIVLALVAVVVTSDDRVRYTTLTLSGLAAWGVLHLAGGLIELDDGRILYNVVIGRWIH